jgi:UDP-glucose 4-epimerase
MTPNPQSPYAVSKLAAEHYCRVFASLYGMETVALRYFNVFGPRQDPASQYSAVIPKFIRAMLGGRQPVIFGDGEQTRDFTFVSNVVDANLRAGRAPCRQGLAMNCACHDRISLNQLVAEINVILGTSITPVFEKPRAGDIKHSFAAIGLVTSELGYAPSVEFRAGLRRTVDWYRERSGEPVRAVTH